MAGPAALIRAGREFSLPEPDTEFRSTALAGRRIMSDSMHQMTGAARVSASATSLPFDTPPQPTSQTSTPRRRTASLTWRRTAVAGPALFDRSPYYQAPG
jgi:hypothetical protein